MNKNQLLNIKKMIFELGRGGCKNHFFDRVNDAREVERFFADAQNDDCENAGKRGRAGARGFCAPHISKARSGHQLTTGLRGFFSKNKESEKNKIPEYKFIREFYFIDAVRRYSGKSAQTGRSMIEMLGVLAIIGVLSVGALSGLNYVMDKNTANQIMAEAYNHANALKTMYKIKMADGQNIYTGIKNNRIQSAYFKDASKKVILLEAPNISKGVCTKLIKDESENDPIFLSILVDDAFDECGQNNTVIFALNGTPTPTPKPTPDPDPECKSDTDCGENYTCQDGVCVCSLINCGECQGLDSSACRCTNLCTSDQVCNDGVCECPQIDSCTSYDENCLCTACESPKIVNSDGTACECPEGCTSGQTQDPTTCACSCIDTTQELWNGKCVPKCDGDGMTGERNENGQCICKAGLDADTCKCPEGTIFVEGTCQEFHCIEIAGATKTYSCYLNGKWCASLCTSATPKNAGDCSGYCNPKFCDGKGTWLQESIPGSGFGCLASNGLYCGTYQKSSMKMCTRKTSALQTKDLCCEAYGDFGVCTRGTCDASDCDAFGGTYTYVADRRWGCEITKNNYTAYCTPFDGSWNCQYAPAANLGISGNPNFCGRCSASELAAGNCGNCFNGVKNCTWGTYNAELDRCVGTLNGIQMSCDFSGNCYYGASKDSNRCAYNCNDMTPGNTPVCHYGMCDETACPAGSEFVYMAGTYLNIYGCQTKRDGYTFFYKDGDAGHNNACFIGQSLCGGYCTKDCSSCEVYNLEACASGRCLKNGSLIDKDGDGVADCTCEGSATNGHCCEKGHVYLNGGCTQLSCPEGQCVTDGGLCKTLTSDICRDDSGLCQTVGDEFARDDNTGACVSK